MSEISIDFELPDHPEPLDALGAWALGLRGLSRKGGQHWEVESEFEGVRVVRVLVPNENALFHSALALLTELDLWCLRAARYHVIDGGPLPPLYDTVCYADEGDREIWSTTYALYQRGHGDCEDLACARAAERLSGHDFCAPDFKIVDIVDGVPLYHVFIRNPDGTIEDPSRELGMFGAHHAATRPRCARFLSADYFQEDGDGTDTGW